MRKHASEVVDIPARNLYVSDGCNFLSGYLEGSHHNNPIMYACSFDTIVVVGKGVREEFHIDHLPSAIARYCQLLKACGYNL